MPQIEYTISINLSQTGKKVWDVLTDFNRYHEWNSVLTMSNNDRIEIGKEFDVTIHIKNGKDSKFKAITIAKEVNKSFTAQQKILGKWFFTATHHFIIEETNSQVSFVQKWELSGVISRLFKKQIFKQLAEFKRMNEELKIYLKKG